MSSGSESASKRLQKYLASSQSSNITPLGDGPSPYPAPSSPYAGNHSVLNNGWMFPEHGPSQEPGDGDGAAPSSTTRFLKPQGNRVNMSIGGNDDDGDGHHHAASPVSAGGVVNEILHGMEIRNADEGDGDANAFDNRSSVQSNHNLTSTPSDDWIERLNQRNQGIVHIISSTF